ncbi:Metallo-hydrolase/oxidoreductase [Punctularia strigosozonata HHB-11173 SS5]|uniref:Metallo-hydrolase/oxidoreductase n=1 Tax=Punctularia strigosozonata (strain HHB-11173) TaxID=741275 RepID=UPI0004417D4F|nr:Metallo-hydrolase/oxidoreductase [Punctularia strigosozonata HHB-11173 SS5]EIN12611.1 Metallo-hydrolase/oxidoreductase [Punctularia strigosozonata HHB-11173 SS5]
MLLPKPGANQNYCHVSALESGMLTLPMEMVLANGEGAPDTPVLSFLLRHSSSGKTIVFDLGIERELKGYPPHVISFINEHFKPWVPQSIEESLRKGGLDPSAVDYVIISHLHWDHSGDPRPFTKATIMVGADSKHICSPGYPEDPSAMVPSELLPKDRTKFMSRDAWKPLGPFPLALDLFDDGSVYVVDAQGHCPGHINLLMRTSADGGWLYLAGDSAHHRHILTGKATMATTTSSDGVVKARMHHDKDKAEAHIRCIAELRSQDRVLVLLSHDTDWYAANKDGNAFWPGTIPAL